MMNIRPSGFLSFRNRRNSSLEEGESGSSVEEERDTHLEAGVALARQMTEALVSPEDCRKWGFQNVEELTVIMSTQFGGQAAEKSRAGEIHDEIKDFLETAILARLTAIEKAYHLIGAAVAVIRDGVVHQCEVTVDSTGVQLNGVNDNDIAEIMPTVHESVIVRTATGSESPAEGDLTVFHTVDEALRNTMSKSRKSLLSTLDVPQKG